MPEGLKKKIMLVSRKAPYGASTAQEALDVALVGSAYNQQISLCFLDDGVYQLLTEQNPQPLGLKNHGKALGALAFYDISACYVDLAGMNKRGLSTPDLCIAAKALSDQQLSELMQQQDVIVSF